MNGPEHIGMRPQVARWDLNESGHRRVIGYMHAYLHEMPTAMGRITFDIPNDHPRFELAGRPPARRRDSPPVA